MGLCFSLMLHKKTKKNFGIKDMSYMTTPVEAARYLHQIKNYDEEVGEFIWNGSRFILSSDGYYKCI